MNCCNYLNNCNVSNDDTEISKTVTNEMGISLIKANITPKGYSITIYNKQTNGCENYYLKTSERNGSFTCYYKTIDEFGRETYKYNSGNEYYYPPTAASITSYLPQVNVCNPNMYQYPNQYHTNPCNQDPSQHNPCQSNPCQSNPCHQDPCKPNPCQSNPCQSNPCQSNPCQSNPCQSNPCHPGHSYFNKPMNHCCPPYYKKKRW